MASSRRKLRRLLIEQAREGTLTSGSGYCD